MEPTSNKIDLEDANVYVASMTKDQARSYFDGEDLPDDVQTALDEAQGYLSEDGQTSYLVIVIKS